MSHLFYNLYTSRFFVKSRRHPPRSLNLKTRRHSVTNTRGWITWKLDICPFLRPKACKLLPISRRRRSLTSKFSERSLLTFSNNILENDLTIDQLLQSTLPPETCEYILADVKITQFTLLAILLLSLSSSTKFSSVLCNRVIKQTACRIAPFCGSLDPIYCDSDLQLLHMLSVNVQLPRARTGSIHLKDEICCHTHVYFHEYVYDEDCFKIQ